MSAAEQARGIRRLVEPAPSKHPATSGTGERPGKLPFDIEVVLREVEAAIKPFPRAALFELAAEGFSSVWEQLVACILSIRTRDETTLPASRALFGKARTAAETLGLTPDQIDREIASCTFHERKAAQIHRIAQQVIEEYGGEVPCDDATLLSFAGVGPKCTNLVLGIACAKPRISVDIHVHRVTNRWGYVTAANPEQTLRVLESKLPKRYWIDINRLLVPFGKHLCTGQLPRCSSCPVLKMCAQVGVEAHR